VGFLNDVETFEMDPHGMGGIGEPAVSESVGREQIAEFVVVIGLGNADDWDKATRTAITLRPTSSTERRLRLARRAAGAWSRMKTNGLLATIGLARKEKNQRYLWYSDDEKPPRYRHQIGSEPRDRFCIVTEPRLSGPPFTFTLSQARREEMPMIHRQKAVYRLLSRTIPSTIC